jgi:hypothetical protein
LAFGLTAEAAEKLSFPNPGFSVWRRLLGFISVNSSGIPLLGLVHQAGGVTISSPCPVLE